MSATALAPVVGAIGPTGFAAIAWGSIALVVAAFAYVLWALVQARGRSSPGRADG